MLNRKGFAGLTVLMFLIVSGCATLNPGTGESQGMSSIFPLDYAEDNIENWD